MWEFSGYATDYMNAYTHRTSIARYRYHTSEIQEREFTFSFSSDDSSSLLIQFVEIPRRKGTGMAGATSLRPRKMQAEDFRSKHQFEMCNLKHCALDSCPLLRDGATELARFQTLLMLAFLENFTH